MKSCTPEDMAYDAGYRDGQESMRDMVEIRKAEAETLRQQLHQAKTKVDELYNLFSYAEQDEDVLNMTGGKPLIGWLREREEEWYKTQGETK